MQISEVKIANSRAVREFSGEFGPVTSFIGYNGGGKSTILKAIEWLFEGQQLLPDDVFRDNSGNSSADPVRVEITFSKLTSFDREVLGKYGRGATFTIAREASKDGSSKLFGTPYVCPQIQEIRDAESIASKRTILKKLSESEGFEAFREVDPKIKAADLTTILDKWEDDPSNSRHLEIMPTDDANHFFGAVGKPKLKECAGFLFLPAAPDLSGQFDSRDKSSYINLLLGTLTKDVIGSAVENWTSENREILDKLKSEVGTAAETGLNDRSTQVNKILKDYLPDIELELKMDLEEWEPKANPVTLPIIRQGERRDPIDSHGHGIQRATLLALLQAVAEGRSVRNDDPSLSSNNRERPSLIVCIEEPEVYQHPVQARALAQAFKEAAEQNSTQFIYATHSPQFVSADHFGSTYRVVPGSNGSTALAAKETQKYGELNNRGQLDKYFAKSVIEGLFSRAVLIVEGETDQFLFSDLKIASNQRSLAEHGVSVIDAEGQGNLIPLASLFQSFGVPVYVVRDGDSCSQVAESRATEKVRNANLNPEELQEEIDKKKDSLLKTWRSQVTTFLTQAAEIDLLHSSEDFRWGRGLQVGRHCSILEHDIEKELESWSEYIDSANGIGANEDLRKEKSAGVRARILRTLDPSSCPPSLKQIVKAVEELFTF